MKRTAEASVARFAGLIPSWPRYPALKHWATFKRPLCGRKQRTATAQSPPAALSNTPARLPEGCVYRGLGFDR